jgi:hypothetical protein
MEILDLLIGVENLNRITSIPLSDASATLTVNRYGTFTANFKPLPPTIPPEFLVLLVGIILSSLFGWSKGAGLKRERNATI